MSKTIGINDLNFCGVAERRYHVIASIGAASEDLRFKRKRESEMKDNKSKESILSIPRVASKSSISPLTAPPTSTIALTTKSNSFPVLRKASIVAVPNIGVSVPSVVPKIKVIETSSKKKPISRTSTSLPLPNQTMKNITNRSTISSNFQTNWMVISNLPKTVCGSDVKNFLNGLKIQNIYGYYHYGSDDNVINNLMDVYIHFDSKIGVEAAMLRNGENILSEMNVIEHKSIRILNNTPYIPRNRIKYVTSLNRVKISELPWVLALCMKLKDSQHDCYYHHQKIRATFPVLLLNISPSMADKKWSSSVPSWKCPTSDEICSYTDHQKKVSSSTFQLYKYNYHEDSGLYLDVQLMCDGVGSTGLSGYLSNQQEILNETELNESDILPIYGVRSIIPIYNEINTIISELSLVLSQELISSYSVLSTTEINYSNDNSVLDLAHRMLSVYQSIHEKIKCIRFSYSNTSNISDK